MSDHSHYLIGPDDGNVLYPEERRSASGIASNFTRNPPPISVAAAEHLATVENERDELRDALEDVVDLGQPWWCDDCKHRKCMGARQALERARSLLGWDEP